MATKTSKKGLKNTNTIEIPWFKIKMMKKEGEKCKNLYFLDRGSNRRPCTCKWYELPLDYEFVKILIKFVFLFFRSMAILYNPHIKKMLLLTSKFVFVPYSWTRRISYPPPHSELGSLHVNYTRLYHWRRLGGTWGGVKTPQHQP